MPNSLRLTLTLGGLSGWCLMLLFFRGLIAGEHVGLFLIQNLGLAAIPLVAAGLFEAMSRKSDGVVPWLYFAAWLLFLPNAPYLVTDLIHLKERPPVPLWLDATALFTLAATGVLFGYTSTSLVHRTLERRYGRRLGWLIIIGCLGLAAFGIYLGRILRWHSWQALRRPLDLAGELWRLLWQLSNDPEPLILTLVFGGSLVFGYLALHALGPLFGSHSSDPGMPTGRPIDTPKLPPDDSAPPDD